MKRKMSLLMAFMMAATLVPAMPANAATKNTILNTVSVESTTTDKLLTTFKIAADNGTDSKFEAGKTDQPFQLQLGEGAEWSEKEYPMNQRVAVTNGFVTKIGQRLLQVEPTSGQSSVEVPMYVNLDGAPEGAQKVTVIPRESTATAGDYTYAMVGSSEVKARVDKVVKISRGSEQEISFILDETVKNAIKTGSEVTLRLPANFYWKSTNDRNVTIKPTADDNKLQTIATSLVIVPEKDAAFGDVDVTFTTSNMNLTPSSLVVAQYVDYGVTAKADKVLNVIAGKDEDGKYKAKITVEESVAGSILSGRYIDFKFVDENGKDVDASIQAGQQLQLRNLAGVKGDKEVKSTAVTSNTSGDILVSDFSVKAGATSSTKTKWELDVPFVVASDFTGKLFLQVKGAGMEEQKVQIADVKAPVTFEVAQPLPQVKIGLQKQPGQNITVKETEAGALQDSVGGSTKVRYTMVPAENFGLTFKSAKVEVTEGNISLDGSGRKDGFLYADVDRKSTKASTIKFSDITVTLDRTVPYGEIKLKGNFGAVDQRHDLTNTVKTFDYFTTVTPVADDKRVVTVFTIGNKGYTEINGIVRDDKQADVAPYLSKEGRTMLPVRYVAQAIGATVNYDPKTRVATFEKNQIVVSVNIDKDVMYVNGSPVKLFSKPANIQNRIFLPLVNIAQAFGLEQAGDRPTIIWNADSKTVTILPQDATMDEVKKAQDGKILDGTVTATEANTTTTTTTAPTTTTTPSTTTEKTTTTTTTTPAQ